MAVLRDPSVAGEEEHRLLVEKEFGDNNSQSKLEGKYLLISAQTLVILIFGLNRKRLKYAIVRGRKEKFSLSGLVSYSWNYSFYFIVALKQREITSKARQCPQRV